MSSPSNFFSVSLRVAMLVCPLVLQCLYSISSAALAVNYFLTCVHHIFVSKLQLFLCKVFELRAVNGAELCQLAASGSQFVAELVVLLGVGTFHHRATYVAQLTLLLSDFVVAHGLPSCASVSIQYKLRCGVCQPQFCLCLVWPFFMAFLRSTNTAALLYWRACFAT